MRYFDDGDLTEGLAIANKPYPFELLLGYWHAVSTSYNGERTTVDYDDPDSPALFRVELEYIEGHKQARPEVKGPRGKKRQRDSEARAHDDLQVSLNYRDWNLEFTGQFGTEEPATVLHLSSNDAPEVGDVDNEATLAFGSVLDDRGYPFLRIMLSACEASSGSDDMVSIEIVAKKTDTTEVHKLELSKNERLRLGFAVRSDGQFEDLVGSGEPKDTYEELARKLGEHSAESARIAQQMQRKRAALDEQLKEAVDAGRRIKSIYNEQRLSLPARTSGQQVTTGGRQSLGSVGPSSQQQQQQQQQQRLISSAPRPSTAPRPSAAPRSSVPMRMRPGNIPVRDDDSTPIIPGSATPGTNNKGKKHCSSCNRTVSLNHGAWIKHINSKKHAEQLKAVGGGLTGGGASGGVSTRKHTPSAKARLSNGIGSTTASPINGTGSGSKYSKPTIAGPKMPRGYALVGISDDEDDDENDNSLSQRRLPRRRGGPHDEENDEDEDMTDDSTDDEDEDIDMHAIFGGPSTTIMPHDGQQQHIGGAKGNTSPHHRRRRRRSGEVPKGETQWCPDCLCQISVKNWNIHTRSNKHQLNVTVDHHHHVGGEKREREREQRDNEMTGGSSAGYAAAGGGGPGIGGDGGSGERMTKKVRLGV